jgi:hypothetical protein
MPSFTPQDHATLRSRGKSPADAEREMAALRGPAPTAKLVRPCRPGDGVLRLSPAAESAYAVQYQSAAPQLRVVKFVAASGSATRMFQAFAEALEAGSPPPSLLDLLPRWAFYDALRDALAARGKNLPAMLAAGDWRGALEFLLSPAGLNYLQLPKALVPYHRYPDGPRTALEEHLLEAQGYARGAGGLVRSHFTVRDAHQKLFHDSIQAARLRFAPASDSWAISTSVQNDSAAAFMLDSSGEPVRDESGALQFASPGHGALLANLNAMEAEVIFIRTVDHVFPERLQREFYHYKHVLGGLFLDIQSRVHSSLHALAANDTNAPASAETLLRDELSVTLPDNFRHLDAVARRRYLFAQLNRPVRVCGVVPNEGKPGGAPFWTLGPSGVARLRIVEECEVDVADPSQMDIWKSSTYFNPVDIACSVHDYLSRPFSLSEFADPGARLLVRRIRNGHPVTILENPGLWNGGMANWISVFLELPSSTIHPVKTVFDLLDPCHCP